MKKLFLALALTVASASPALAKVEDYTIDVNGAHAFIQFKISHLGYSWLLGRFNTFEGEFSVDPENFETGKVEVTIDTTSVDSNHAERDKHLKSSDFLNVEKFPEAKFVSTKVTDVDGKNFKLVGDLTLHGVTKEVVIDAEHVGRGEDPWGGFRTGFAGTTTIKLGDFGISEMLGPQSAHVQLELHVEGIRK